MKKLLMTLCFIWVMKDCFTLDDVTKLLNTLPVDQANSAKIVSINSQRSPLGVFSSPYRVWYNKDLV